jgi:hypothetical protein
MENSKEKECCVFVFDKIKSIDRDKKKITFVLNVPEHLNGVKNDVDLLLQELIKQQLDFFCPVKIQGLRLEWNYIIESEGI